MSIKVDNNRLEVLLNEYNNHANELAYFLSPTEISYKNNEEIINNVSNLNVLVGLELSTYLNIIIISNGYFYDNELNKIINFEKPNSIKIENLENGKYGIYYIFSNESFIYSLNEPEEKYRKIGEFEYKDSNIIKVYPKQDLATSYENRFITAEQLGTTGYRIYSDGWKEQWGVSANPTFPVAFDEIPLIVTNGATNITTTNMTIADGYWYACGY